MINHFELFGLKQVFDYCKAQQCVESAFTVRYFYAFVRHPLMLGFLITMWATPTMSAGHLLFSIVTTLYILLAVKYLEERDLKRAIGKDYEEYQCRVPMVIARIVRYLWGTHVEFMSIVSEKPELSPVQHDNGRRAFFSELAFYSHVFQYDCSSSVAITALL